MTEDWHHHQQRLLSFRKRSQHPVCLSQQNYSIWLKPREEVSEVMSNTGSWDTDSPLDR